MSDQEHDEQHKTRYYEDLARIKQDLLKDNAWLDALTDELDKRLAKRIMRRGSYLPGYTPVQETK